MKKLITFVLIAILSFANTYANKETKKGENPNQQLRNEISVLLKNPGFELQQDQTKANIEFTLNNKGEIVILTVDADKEEIAGFVKNRLNYQRVDAGKNISQNQVFKLKLTVLQSK